MTGRVVVGMYTVSQGSSENTPLLKRLSGFDTLAMHEKNGSESPGGMCAKLSVLFRPMKVGLNPAFGAKSRVSKTRRLDS